MTTALTRRVDIDHALEAARVATEDYESAAATRDKQAMGDAAASLAEAFDTLDRALSAGGDLPCAWRTARSVDHVVAEGSCVVCGDPAVRHVDAALG